MITRIQAQNYRCFDHLDVRLGQYNMLAGANGSGKTTLIDIPLLFSDMLSSNNLAQAFLGISPASNMVRIHRLRDIPYCHKGDYFSFVLEAALPQEVIRELVAELPENVQINRRRWPHSLRYEIRLQLFSDIELQVTDEYLWLVPEDATQGARGLAINKTAPSSWRNVILRDTRDSDHVIRGGTSSIKIRSEIGRRNFSFDLRPDELALKNLPLDKSLFPAAFWFITMLRTGTIWYEPDIAKLQQDSELATTNTILPDASNLPWQILNLQREHPNNYTDWVAHVQTALPQIKQIEAIAREDGTHAYLNVTYKGDYTISSSGLSNGTLRIFALTILPYLPEPPAILCLEEPENGLHPLAIEVILQSLTSLYDSQILLSTHSPLVLAHTELSSVIIMQSRDDGEKYAVAGTEHERLQNWRGEIDLGSLFASGVLE